MPRRIGRMAVVGFLGMVLLAACGSDDGDKDPTVGDEARAFASEVTLEDVKFNPSELTIPANTPVTLNLINRGRAVHNFNIDALNVHSGDYISGQTGTVTIKAAQGEYEYYCSIYGHRMAGMVGTLIAK